MNSTVNCRAAEEDIEAQRQELMAGFDNALRKREHEFRKKADDLSNSLLASELKVCLRVRCVCYKVILVSFFSSVCICFLQMLYQHESHHSCSFTRSKFQ